MDSDDNHSEKGSFIGKVYGTLVILLITTIYLCFWQRTADKIVEEPTPEVKTPAKKTILRRHEVSDSSLRKVSISAMNLLIVRTDKGYELAPLMADFIKAIRNKYRVYILCRVTAEPGDSSKAEREKVHALMKSLVDDGTIKGEHRLMYSSSEAGELA